MAGAAAGRAVQLGTRRVSAPRNAQPEHAFLTQASLASAGNESDDQNQRASRHALVWMLWLCLWRECVRPVNAVYWRAAMACSERAAAASHSRHSRYSSLPQPMQSLSIRKPGLANTKPNVALCAPDLWPYKWPWVEMTLPVTTY